MGIEFVKDEADKSREALHEQSVDPKSLRNLDPDKHYRWVADSARYEGRAIANRQARGYSIDKDPEKGTPFVSRETPDGAKRYGDLILMSQPKEMHEARVALLTRRGDLKRGEAVGQARENINRMARDSGLVGPHEDAIIDTSREGETQIARRRS